MNVLQYIVCFLTFLLIALIATSARAYTRHRINRGLHIEDWLAIVAFCVLLVQITLSCIFTPRYTFLIATPPRDILAALSPDTTIQGYIKRTLEYQVGSHLGFLTSLWLIKFSFLFFYKRLAEGRAWSKLWLFTFIFCFLSYIGNVVGYFFVCVPLSTYFDTTCQSQTGRSNASLYGATATDIISDLLIMAIPLRLIRQLRMSTLQKVGLACLFCLGFAVVVLSLARTIRINAGGTGAYPQSDPRWVALWSIAEEATAIVVCCLPAIRKLFSAHQEKRGDTSNSTPVDGLPGHRAPRRFSIKRWSLKYGLKSIESTVSRTRSDSMIELESGSCTVPSSPPWPVSPRKPEGSFIKIRSFDGMDLMGLPGVIPSPPGTLKGRL
ncbi:hypothetical protein H072_4399 [Dactylellina haptotyla CBS 200.50]|uniref:Rhodopsin domain-containing protein n=1 Tax=Dactylellina haptotyla (strain CBS 200.50) TaxID=1284197 RepID=S8AFQ7_DACHA|nr:hypothetical protein H072_4399 [Dactylellina haptotyla CBS 200.50]